jgi:hypothetical protein
MCSQCLQLHAGATNAYLACCGRATALLACTPRCSSGEGHPDQPLFCTALSMRPSATMSSSPTAMMWGWQPPHHRLLLAAAHTLPHRVRKVRMSLTPSQGGSTGGLLGLLVQCSTHQVDCLLHCCMGHDEWQMQGSTLDSHSQLDDTA